MTAIPVPPSPADSPPESRHAPHTTREPTPAVAVRRGYETLHGDDKRVITRFFGVGGDVRARKVISRVARLPEAEVSRLLAEVHADFEARHRDIEDKFERNFNQIKRLVPDADFISRDRRLLLGSYFTMEYSIESAALFNPSIVPHPDQTGCPKSAVRFIMSLRATGEGHVSSIVFRTGILTHEGDVQLDPPSHYAAKMRVRQDRSYEKKLFFLKLIEMAAYSDAARVVLDELPQYFTFEQLQHKLREVRERPARPSPFSETEDNMLWLARSNYHIDTPPKTTPQEIVIFPTSENETRGIEDCRLTPFRHDDGKLTFFGTYTAYNGFRVLPQLLETRDFHSFEIHTLNGKYVQNKGMALFPRMIDGLYHMIGRLDGENMFLMRSDNPHFWNEAVKLIGPVYPWEFVQIGNCGPPIETDRGWLLLTHGVGPMRRYCIGVNLLDLDDPSKVIAHLPQPLIVPGEEERNGYVPNVVYSCGALAHGDTLLIPYAVSDSASTFATLSISQLLDALVRTSTQCPVPEVNHANHTQA